MIREIMCRRLSGGAGGGSSNCVLVSIRKPNRALGKGYSGGRVAAPVAKEILEKTLIYWGILEEPAPAESEKTKK